MSTVSLRRARTVETELDRYKPIDRMVEMEWSLGRSAQPDLLTMFVARRRKCLEIQGLRLRRTQAYSKYAEEADRSATQ